LRNPQTAAHPAAVVGHAFGAAEVAPLGRGLAGSSLPRRARISSMRKRVLHPALAPVHREGTRGKKPMPTDSFHTQGSLEVQGVVYSVFRLAELAKGYPAVARLPFSLKVLLENLLRHEDGRVVRREHAEKRVDWEAKAPPETEHSFHGARVLLQDFTGVPAVVDLAAMREALAGLGGDANKINPRNPADLVIDHSVVVDQFGSSTAFAANAELEFERNRERYAFLRWGQDAFRNFKVVPPDTGIVHQVNLEYLARVVFVRPTDGNPWAYPDTVVGTDSHTTMINGLGVLGWGVRAIEAESANLGQPISM